MPNSTTNMPTSSPEPNTPSSNSKRKFPASLARSHTPAKRTKSTEHNNINSDAKRKAQVPKLLSTPTPFDGAGKKKSKSPGNKLTSVTNTNSKSPNAAVQTETPNIHLVSQQVAGPPTPNHLTKELQSTEDSETHHNTLF